ncbi:sigma-70 family RNA polymerase sigma factor [Devosia algicola]|uniref:Sigma-70 family RNA polymerase sigma factor n=1 Tax=Devosia algicola TaxID=3026418 RepID=A0ABY7YSE3_9HYPH|nr:sigma-70 family RNA polymerase sigma factor [Devosia algicola]WDR04278.1 sigma-70 family RNA polymerase sigma factor [Devosia algicola]
MIDDLVRRAQAGEADAFGQILAHHYDQIYRTAYKWCGDKADAEDVTQDVCVKLGSAIGSFDGRARFSSWLYRVVLNSVRDLQRARARRVRHVDALAQVSAHQTPPDQEASATASQLWKAVRTLPENQRDAVLLVYAEELSHAAAARIMACREATVSWYVHEARKTLKGLL